jgi:hypothetical protein
MRALLCVPACACVSTSSSQLTRSPRPFPPSSWAQAALGYRGQRGHRLWRRIKPLLVKRGHIEDFLARTAGDKTVR